MMLNDPVIFSAPIWGCLLVGIFVLAVVIMALVYIRRLKKGSNEDRADAIRVVLLLQQNRSLLKRVIEHSDNANMYVKELEKQRYDLTLEVMELKSRMNYYENGTLVVR